MEFMNPLSLLVAAVSALVVGFIWYNPKVFGNAWMKAAGMTDEQVKGGNMAKIFVLRAKHLPGKRNCDLSPV